MRLNYYYNNPNLSPKTLCTAMDVDLVKKTIHIKNYTDNILYRAFGVITEPTWDQFENFLASRCVPKERYNIEDILEDYGLRDIGYDPLAIIRKTNGKMAEDHMELEIA